MGLLLVRPDFAHPVEGLIEFAVFGFGEADAGAVEQHLQLVAIHAAGAADDDDLGAWGLVAPLLAEGQHGAFAHDVQHRLAIRRFFEQHKPFGAEDAERQVVDGIAQRLVTQRLIGLVAPCVEDEGVVVGRREQTFVYYSVQDPKLLRLLKALKDIYC